MRTTKRIITIFPLLLILSACQTEPEAMTPNYENYENQLDQLERKITILESELSEYQRFEEEIKQLKKQISDFEEKRMNDLTIIDELQYESYDLKNTVDGYIQSNEMARKFINHFTNREINELEPLLSENIEVGLNYIRNQSTDEYHEYNFKNTIIDVNVNNFAFIQEGNEFNLYYQYMILFEGDGIAFANITLSKQEGQWIISNLSLDI